MPKKEYRSLFIPESLYLQVKECVENSNGRYVSISEVAREAIWKFLYNTEGK